MRSANALRERFSLGLYAGAGPPSMTTLTARSVKPTQDHDYHGDDDEA